MHLTAYDVLTVASLIEAEASSDKARPLVASVIYNRLKDHMMLQFDSTTRYATGNFTRPLKVSQLHSQLAVEHPHPLRPAADPDRQPQHGVDRGRRPSGAARLPVLLRQAVQQRHGVRQQLRPVPADSWPASGRSDQARAGKLAPTAAVLTDRRRPRRAWGVAAAGRWPTAARRRCRTPRWPPPG